MARCDQGYLCDVCGEEVETIRDSDLYLRFVTGQLDSRQLLSTPERHIRCNPVVAQFIRDPEFAEVTVTGPFARTEMDAEFVRNQEALLTRGWQRLQELAEISDSVTIADYPLPEFRTASRKAKHP